MITYDWTTYNINHAIDLNRLRFKLDGINQHVLVSTMEAFYREVMADPHVEEVGSADMDELVGDLKSMARSPQWGSCDHCFTLKTLGVIALTIAVRHFVELTRVESQKNHKTLVDHIKVDPVLGKITVMARSRGLYPIPMSLYQDLALQSLQDFTEGMILSDSWDAFCGEYGQRIALGKMILELMTLDDYDLGAIREYAKSQHDWVLSSIMTISSQNHRYSNKEPAKYHCNYITAVMSSLLHGCKAQDGKITVPAIEHDPETESHASRDVVFIEAIKSSRLLRKTDCYDSEILMSFFGRLSQNGVKFITTQTDYDNMIDGPRCKAYRDLIPYRDNDLSFNIRYHSWDIIPSCQAAVIPELKGKITKESLFELEGRTRFLRSYLFYSLFGESSTNLLRSVVGDDGRTISGESMADLAVTGVGLNSTFGHSLIPIMIRPEEKAIGSIAIEFVPRTTYDDETSRFLAFSKCYAIHQVMHYGETTMDQGVWMELDPMDWFLMGDVINSAKRAYRNGFLWIDPSSDLYGELLSRCLKACEDVEVMNATLPSDYFQKMIIRKNTVRRVVKRLYRSMAFKGVYDDLDGVMEELDSVLIKAIINHYVDYEVHGDDNEMPKSFIRESLVMDTESEYEDVLEAWSNRVRSICPSNPSSKSTPAYDL